MPGAVVVGGVVGWIVCGVLAYGLAKQDWYLFLTRLWDDLIQPGYVEPDTAVTRLKGVEWLFWLAAILGPIGLIAVLIVAQRHGADGLRFRA